MRSADWRAQLRSNHQRSMMVVLTFILLMIAVGLLIDTVVVYELKRHTQRVLSRQYGYSNFEDWAFSSEQLWLQLKIILEQLIRLEIFPWCSLGLLSFAGLSLMGSLLFGNRVMLMGTDYRRVTGNSQNPTEKMLFNIVTEMKIAANMNFMPKIYMIDANYMNAFASGFNEKTAMIAITHGLIKKLNREELQAVVAHELSHIRHDDIRLTMLVAILSNVLLMAIDALFYGFVHGRRNRERNNYLAFIIIILRWILPILTIVLMFYLSRRREFMADAGAVELMRNNGPLARALIKIHEDHEEYRADYSEEYGDVRHENVRHLAYLYDPTELKIDPVLSFTSWFSTHPSLKERLEAIGYTHRT